MRSRFRRHEPIVIVLGVLGVAGAVSAPIRAARAAMASPVSETEVEAQVRALPERTALPFSGDFSGGYSWGNYDSATQSADTHSGMAMQLYGGMRIGPRLNVGITGTYAFPQIAPPQASSEASFSYRSIGLQLGLLWNGFIEPFVHFSPYAKLTQTSKSRQGPAMVSTDLSYTGQAYGGGFKVYLSDRALASAQVGLKFSYTRESYSRASVDTSVDGPGGRAPALSPAAAILESKQSLVGNSYQLGLFLGI